MKSSVLDNLLDKIKMSFSFVFLGSRTLWKFIWQMLALSASVDKTDFASNTQVNMIRIDSKELKQLLVLKFHIFFIHKQKAHMDA